MQDLSMTPQQCANNIISRSCKVADIYDESILNDVLVEGVSQSIPQSCNKFYQMHRWVYTTAIAFRVDLLLAIQKKSCNQSINNQQQTRSVKRYTRKPWNNCRGADNVNRDTTSSFSCSLRRWSQLPLLIRINPQSAEALHSSSASSS